MTIKVKFHPLENAGNTLIKQGLAQYNEKNYDLANEAFLQAVKLSANDIDKALCLMYCGLTKATQGLYDLAILDYKQAITLFPNQCLDKAICFIRIAKLCKQQRLLNEAVTYYREAYALFPNHIKEFTNVFYQSALQYQAENEHDAAIANFEEAVLSFDKDIQAEYAFKRANDFMAQNKLDLALQEINCSLLLFIESNNILMQVECFCKRADIFIVQCKFSLARIDSEIGSALSPIDSQKIYALCQLGFIYTKTGHEDLADRYFAMALEVSSDDNSKAKVHFYQGISGKKTSSLTITHFSNAASLYSHPHHKASCYFNIGECYYTQGLYADALINYAYVSQLKPGLLRNLKPEQIRYFEVYHSLFYTKGFFPQPTQEPSSSIHTPALTEAPVANSMETKGQPESKSITQPPGPQNNTHSLETSGSNKRKVNFWDDLHRGKKEKQPHQVQNSNLYQFSFN